MGQIITVNFRGDQLYGFENDDGTFVALKPIVESMGMDWSAQYRRAQRDPILSEGIAIMATPFGRGGDQEAVCLKLELVNGWLFTIDTARIKDDAVRERVLLYQRECYTVLHKHFYGRSTADRSAAITGSPTAEETIKVRKSLVTEARQTFSCQAARELWFKLNLPTTPAMFADENQYEMFTYTAIKRDPPIADQAA
ncbi:phage antirepressor N-terminal domain-containing protein [Bosea sp. (in: a-proteobacteria)]|uniref:phage antirepressor N-terminal domain-containing protein n=1 Tax=Bosea sp. (in: a-proteobacteria) TaxID=1871050 RepID=UPI0026373F61|nr:phage antirepressor N-terminal domain-containing protein [Bosea sp. (in: a-proteobacteria)]MCO5092672.1 phage antirepressor N-terminal domain-containing protein [Bosea sp. (in: a-proteobacteria)]